MQLEFSCIDSGVILSAFLCSEVGKTSVGVANNTHLEHKCTCHS